MSIGIYALYWEEQDLVYIGKSVNLNKRNYEHFRLLKNGEHATKLQNAYNEYGLPIFIILCECTDKELDLLEVQRIAEFNAINSLNTLPGGQDVGKDTTHAAAKFTKEQILEVCELLLNYTISQKEISKITGISEAVISTILNGSRHTWIPAEIRTKLDNIKSARYEYNLTNSKNKNYSLESPDGIVYNNILNVSQFARTHKLLETKLNEVLKGKRAHHLGWKLSKIN